MSNQQTVLVLSDIHYAGPLERQRPGYESRAVSNPLLRGLLKAWRYFIWLRDPFAHNHLLDRVVQQPHPVDHVVALGDYSCDSAFVGVSDDAACQSARTCLDKLRQRFGPRCHAVVGDHELGKLSLFGGQGGMRLASWHRAQAELGLEPFWRVEAGRYVLMGVTSSVIAFSVFEPEALPDERAEWHRLRSEHLEAIRRVFEALRPDQRVLLFCHDPTALPFLWQEDVIRARLPQLEQTFVGHLHTNLIIWKCRLLAGMPTIRFLGNAARRMSSALSQAKLWPLFKVRLCPSLAGSELLKDGGYYLVTLDQDARAPARFELQRLSRRPTQRIGKT